MKYRNPKYVHCYSDRHGTGRIYFRKSPRRQIALPGPLYSPAFWTAYHMADRGELTKAPPIGMVRSKPGTMGALIAEYYQSAKFTSLAPSTRATYRNQLEHFRVAYGDKPIALVQTKHVEAILGKIAETSTAQAHKLRKRLSTLMQLAVKWDYRTDNPMLNVERIKHKERGYRSWTEEDIKAFRNRWPDDTPQRIAFEILLFTGLRRSDAVRLGRQHLRDGYFVIRTKKSGETTQLELPVHPTLMAHLASVPGGHLTYIVTQRGQSRSEKAFTNWFREAAHKAGLPHNSSPHGLRKAACRRLAEAGCSAHQIMAITGHKNLSEVELYTRAANMKQLAQSAMAAINDCMQVNKPDTKTG